MLSLDKIKKGISEIRESGGIGAIGDSVKAGIGNLRDSVTEGVKTGVGNLRNSVTEGVKTGVGNLRNSVTAGIGRVSSISSSGIRPNLFSNPRQSRPMASASSLSSSSSSSSRQRVRPGKLSLYIKNISTKRLSVPIKCVGSNIKGTLENILRSNIEGKCSIEGYVKQRSCNIITYSCGLVTGNLAIFTVVYECLVCNPSQGMRISCAVKNITNAGILAHVDDSEYSPVNIFIARDHHYNIPYFSELKEGDEIMIRVIGQRFELNDTFVSVLGELELERQREPRNSLRREIEMSQKEKGKEDIGPVAGALSTILEETGLSEPSVKQPEGEGEGVGEGEGAGEGEGEGAGEAEEAGAEGAAAAAETDEGGETEEEGEGSEEEGKSKEE
jgi:DNA-directed RNA polymerase subunit E'/Rpb7